MKRTASYAQPLLGLVIVSLGLGFLLDAIGVLDFSKYLALWWPVLIVIVGVLSWVSNPQLRLWPIVIIGGGVLFLLHQLGLLGFNPWSLLWPFIVIAIGLSLIVKRKGPTPREQDSGDLNVFVAFSGSENRVNAPKFGGGKITALFGGAKVNFLDAILPKEGATIDVFTAFGGTELVVPKGWRVETSGLPIFGGWEDKTDSPEKNAPVLTIRGTSIFGGVEIKN